jgi:hypothetical protein
VNRTYPTRLDPCTAMDLPVPVRSTADGGTPVSGLVSVTYAAWVRVLSELARMVPFVGDTGAGACMGRVRAAAGVYLHRIEEGILRGGIQPWSPIRPAPETPMPPLSPSASRIGVFPLSASPFEWSHLLAGMAAMAELGLDHVVYIVTEGAGQESALLPREVRHAMTRDLLGRFPPLFLYSPVGFQQDGSGALSLFHLLSLNASQPMEVFLIAGGTGGIGERTSEELIDTVRSAMTVRRGGYDESMHPITVVTATPGDAAHGARRSPVRVQVELPLASVLPGAIPAALSGETGREALAALPYTAFRHIRRLGTYSSLPA